MRRLDDLPRGTYELELVRELRTADASSSLSPGGAFGAGVARRVLRVLATSEEVEDNRWDTLASPSARFRARVGGVGDVVIERL
jgi:hypothetical protein